jgi:hypothetical protein
VLLSLPLDTLKTLLLLVPLPDLLELAKPEITSLSPLLLCAKALLLGLLLACSGDLQPLLLRFDDTALALRTYPHTRPVRPSSCLHTHRRRRPLLLLPQAERCVALALHVAACARLHAHRRRALQRVRLLCLNGRAQQLLAQRRHL